MQRDSDLWQLPFLIKMLTSDNIRLIRISTIIQFSTLLEEFRFLLERTISGVDLLKMESSSHTTVILQALEDSQ